MKLSVRLAWTEYVSDLWSWCRYNWPWLFQSIPTQVIFVKSKPRITKHKKFLYTMNLQSNSCEPSVTEYITIPNGSKFGPSAKLAFAYT